MAPPTPYVPHDVIAPLKYHLEVSQGGSDFYYVGAAGEKRRPGVLVNTLIKDIRGEKPEEFKVNVHGFQVVTRDVLSDWFETVVEIKGHYYADCQDLVKEVTGASKVLIMSHIVRKEDWQTQFEAEKDLPDMTRSEGVTPANFVHVDQSYNGAPHRIAENYPQEATKLSNKRWAIINVWRPLGTVTRSALAVCDARSIRESELREIQARFPPTTKEGNDPFGGRKPFCSWSVVPPRNPGDHGWYYVSEMRKEEAFVLKIFDTKIEEGLARRSPHTAFMCESDHGPPRESCEVRCLVVWEE